MSACHCSPGLEFGSGVFQIFLDIHFRIVKAIKTSLLRTFPILEVAASKVVECLMYDVASCDILRHIQGSPTILLMMTCCCFCFEITQSTVSFFQDRSVSLGRLIGLRPGERGGFYFPKSIRFEDDKRPSRDAHTDDSGGQRAEMSQGICMPQLLGALVKMNRIKSKSRK